MSAEHKQKVADAMRMLEVEREVSLKRVIKAHRKLRSAQDDYEEAVLSAVALGLGATTIAREIGVSETAVRTYVKRRNAAR